MLGLRLDSVCSSAYAVVVVEVGVGFLVCSCLVVELVSLGV